MTPVCTLDIQVWRVFEQAVKLGLIASQSEILHNVLDTELIWQGYKRGIHRR